MSVACLQANVDELETNDPQARCQVLLVGKLAMVVDLRNHSGYGLIFRSSELLQNVPKRTFQSDGGGVPVNTQRASLGQKLRVLIVGGAQPEQLVQGRHIIKIV